jgi:hypothetical protein
MFILNLESLKASAVLMVSTYALNPKPLVFFVDSFEMLNGVFLIRATLNAVCTSADPCSNTTPRKHYCSQSIQLNQRKSLRHM